MPSDKLNGTALGTLAVGSLLLYSGITGKSVLASVQAIVSGKSPKSLPNSAPVVGQDTTAASTSAGTSAAIVTGSGGSAAANQLLAKQLASAMGHADWTTGQNWADWVSLWNQESGWMDEANPTSDARGIAQKITGYGPDYVKGDMKSQITWGINYISGRYGNPAMAWAHEQANNWY